MFENLFVHRRFRIDLLLFCFFIVLRATLNVFYRKINAFKTNENKIMKKCDKKNQFYLFNWAIGQFADQFLFGRRQQEISLPSCFAGIVRLQIGLQFLPHLLLRIELSVGCALVAIDIDSVARFRSGRNVQWFDGLSTVGANKQNQNETQAMTVKIWTELTMRCTKPFLVIQRHAFWPVWDCITRQRIDLAFLRLARISLTH